MTAAPKDTKEEVRTRPFADVLLDIDKGRLHSEASTGLQELIEAVMETGKAGTMQLTFKVTKSKSDTPMVQIVSGLAVKRPQADRGASIFYVDDEANLSRQNPHQERLPLAGVPDTTDTTRTEQQLREIADNERKLREVQ